uniref:Ubiquitin-like protease family profile domain-containing protein n=1 Tax=Ditylenchus dipsaci TaxID=166011 RepID=A0A915E3U5_9BILA
MVVIQIHPYRSHSYQKQREAKVQRGIDEVYYEMIADTRIKALVKKEVEEWQEIVPMYYLSGIASNFRMAQGPYIIPEKETVDDDQENIEDNEAAAHLHEIEKGNRAKVVVSRFSIELTDDDILCPIVQHRTFPYQKGHQEKDPVNWLGFNDKMITQQSNSYDCGIFICLFAESVSRDIRPDFKQQQVKEIRRRISKEILDGVISEPKKIDESIVG